MEKNLSSYEKLIEELKREGKIKIISFKEMEELGRELNRGMKELRADQYRSDTYFAQKGKFEVFG